MKGIAFEFGDTTYTCANRTMVTSTKGTIKRGRDRGASKEKGYWLDVLNGPLIPLGLPQAQRMNQWALYGYVATKKGLTL